MDERLGYVVVTFNQASHQPDIDTGSALHCELETARLELAERRAATAAVGRGERHVIAEVIELEDADG